jgi:hypothetical protein
MIVLRWIRSHLLLVGSLAASAVILTLILMGVRYLKEKNERIADLITRLATSETTVEIERGLFAKKAEELQGLQDLLAKMGEENAKLSELIKRGEMEILTLNQIIIRWRKAYEAAVAANQTEEPPKDPGDPVRKRVTFSGKVGPIKVDGHTLTDPPESWLHLEQIDPIRLTVAVTRNKDGTFSSLVTSSDLEVQADIVVSAVDPKVLGLKWYQRIWLDGAVSMLGDKSASLGVTYHADRWSVGSSCHVGEYGLGCGLTMGYRLFR